MSSSRTKPADAAVIAAAANAETFALAPGAGRVETRRWRDPRLWIGCAIVLASIVAGARLFASSDDSISVWRLGSDVSAGEPVTRSDLTATTVRFDDASVAAAFASTAEPFPDGATFAESMRAGDLLVRSVISPASTVSANVVPIAVQADGVPPDVRVGMQVDVWTVPQRAGAPEAALNDVSILSVEPLAGGGSGDLMISVGVVGDQEVQRLLSGLRDSSVVLVEDDG